jgi:hypothetical protein
LGRRFTSMVHLAFDLHCALLRAVTLDAVIQG